MSVRIERHTKDVHSQAKIVSNVFVIKPANAILLRAPLHKVQSYIERPQGITVDFERNKSVSDVVGSFQRVRS